MLKQKTLWIICGILLITAGCAPKPSQVPTQSPLPPAPSPFVPRTDAISEVDAMFTNLADGGLFSGAVLVAHQGEVLLSQRYGFADRIQEIPNTPQTQFRIASMTKQFTAAAIMLLQEEGELNVSDPFCDYIPDCPEQWGEITVHHLLSHTSGIPNYIYWEMDPDLSREPPGEFVDSFKELPLDFQPGEKWNYSNAGYIILGYLIEQVTGLPYEVYLREAILDPLDMDATGYQRGAGNLAFGYFDKYTSDPVTDLDLTTLYASGGLYSNAEDLFHWSQALYGDKLLSQKSRDQMCTPYAVTTEAEGASSYGYACFIATHNGHPTIYHGGSIAGFTSLLAHHPQEGVTIIILSNLDVEIVKVEYLGSRIADILLGEE